MGKSIKSQSLGKKYNLLTKCSKDKLHINDMNTFYSLRMANCNKNEFQNLQDLKETGYVEEQVFEATFVNSYKNGPFIVGVKQTFIT